MGMWSTAREIAEGDLVILWYVLEEVDQEVEQALIGEVVVGMGPQSMSLKAN